ncbi:hypothetical protein BX616_000998 [Lobosporangium transversale]|uniref:Myb-like domain-containing protein n=1 Tax=Lobosporangium transversale TaxID=64571 RepID=A0A1Y2GTN3_9FUNG|nr:hypothetical protein BCR41DRAFT_349819 [Lobosporangium transversale]KAF9905517.1 hypothetical protein BX616_000998 [Lobosporangium transversale]ORZ22869.1 hypothetical protein BCR41DRAFT_349819 [Lobosporangium transversale]|eukprot:XP_021883423.1 hypothetical protein BCR41DRAFT_349819 [Lobosporangium transversale]
MSQQHMFLRKISPFITPRVVCACIRQSYPQGAIRSSQRYTLRYSSNSSSSPSSSSSFTVITTEAERPIVLKRPKPDTARKADLSRNKPIKSRDHSGINRNNNGNSNNKIAPQEVRGGAEQGTQLDSALGSKTASRKWTPEDDAEIIRLVRQGMQWSEIDTALNRPHSQCYERYFTALDPNIQSWYLPDGRLNQEMIRRLVYLVDVEGHSFKAIVKLELMKEPWEIPTKHAPQELLETLKTGATSVPSSSISSSASKPSEAPTRPGAASSNQNKGQIGKRSKRFRPVNRLFLQKKYLAYKSNLTANAIRTNREIMERAIQRSVELYGENWKKVASYADELLDQWTPSKAATPIKLSPIATTGEDSALPKAKILQDRKDTDLIQEREPLTPNKAASIYRALQRKGVDWGLEDDVIMARKVLEFSRSQPDILDVLEKPLPEDQGHPAAEPLEEQEKLQYKYWTELSTAVGTHTVEQCKRRWDGLWALQDNEKSAKSKAFHRTERLYFWMLWAHFYQHQPLRKTVDINHNESDSSNDKSYDAGLKNHSKINDRVLVTKDSNQHIDLEQTLKEVSFAKDISRWMRHRSEAQCDLFFRTSVMSAFARLGIISAPDQGKQGQKQEDEDGSSEHTKAIVAQKNIDMPQGLRLILHEIAEPMITKLTTVLPQDGTTYQPWVLRPEWTREKIQALQELVHQAKQGVKRSDFELDWNKIAGKLSERFGIDINSRNNGNVSGGLPSFSAKQCQDCWECIATTRYRPTESKVLPSSSAEPNTEHDGHDGLTQDRLLHWSDRDLQLLQQGVRKYGTFWADIRAQFLPNKDLSDLYQTWQVISAPSEEEDLSNIANQSEKFKLHVGRVNRLLDPDYQGLLGALDKVNGSGSKNNDKRKSKSNGRNSQGASDESEDRK